MNHMSREEILSVQHQASAAERLLALAAFVEVLPPKAVTFTCWYRKGVGCVIGLAAALDPWFRAQGLTLADTENPQLCHPVYQGKTDWHAVAAFFGLSRSQCRHLFTQEGYDGELRPCPRLVATRIREHLGVRDHHQALPEADTPLTNAAALAVPV